MSIEKKCENCSNYQEIDDDKYYCKCIGGTHYKEPCVENNLMFFRPSEKAIRKDERNKIIDLIEFSPLVVCDGKDSWICNKAIQAYREKLLYKLKNLKVV